MLGSCAAAHLWWSVCNVCQKKIPSGDVDSAVSIVKPSLSSHCRPGRFLKMGRQRWFITMDDINEGPLVKDGLAGAQRRW